MPGFLGALGALGSLMPGYIQGREAAIKGNWQDAEKYNTVQRGQMENAFSALDFPLAYNRDVDATNASRLNTLAQTQQFNEYMAGGPGRVAGARILNQFTPALTYMGIQDQLGNLMQQESFRQLMNQWGLQVPQAGTTGVTGTVTQTTPTAATEQNIRQGIQ